MTTGSRAGGLQGLQGDGAAVNYKEQRGTWIGTGTGTGTWIGTGMGIGIEAGTGTGLGLGLHWRIVGW